MHRYSATGLLLLLPLIHVIAAEQPKYAQRAVLGISLADVVPGLEDVLSLPTHVGAYIVSRETPPERDRTGIPAEGPEAGDLIIMAASLPVRRSADVQRILQGKRPGDIVSLTVLRAGQHVSMMLRLKEGDPFIYLPATTCPVPTTGALIGLDLPGIFFLGMPLTGISAWDLAGTCRNLVPACTALALVKQKENRTMIDLNGFNHEIPGNWTRHTHASVESCRDEQSALEAKKSAWEAAVTPAPPTR